MTYRTKKRKKKGEGEPTGPYRSRAFKKRGTDIYEGGVRRSSLRPVSFTPRSEGKSTSDRRFLRSAARQKTGSLSPMGGDHPALGGKGIEPPFGCAHQQEALHIGESIDNI